MKVCGIMISKRRVELCLVQHYDFVNMEGGAKFHLLKQQTLYVPKYFIEKPLDMDYTIRGLEILEEADLIKILHDCDKKTSETTRAIKEIIFLLMVEQVKRVKIPYYSEQPKVLQYRMGKRKFMNHHGVLDWLIKNIDNLSRKHVLGKRNVTVAKIMCIAAACDTKKDKYNWSKYYGKRHSIYQQKKS